MPRNDTRDIARRLAAAPAFAGCKSRDLEELARRSQHSSVPAGWTLISQDTPGDACYVILDGVATVSIRGEVVNELGAGSVVGETALATGKLRNANVSAKTPLDLLHLDAAAFEAVTGRRPALRDALLSRSPASSATL